MNSTAPFLPPAHCLELSGPGARRFAQAQFSGNVDALVADHWQWNAWLTPQGRVRALMQLADTGDGRLLAILRGGGATAIRDGLARYLLRVPATVTLHEFAARAGAPAPENAVVRDDDAIVLGLGPRSLRLTTAEAMLPDPAIANTWLREDIVRGWPTLPPGEPEFLPPALGLERLGAVAFEKGCYPGQEIAARLHFRGGHKQQLYHLRGAKPLPKGRIELAGAGHGWVLDMAKTGDIVDVLMVAPIGFNRGINILGNIYQPISGFGP